MKSTTLPLRFLELNDKGAHLLLEIKINGKKARVLIDTGASNTVFDKHRLHAFLKGARLLPEERLSTGLGTNSMESQAAVLQKIELGALLIEDHYTLVLDLSHVNSSYGHMKIKPIDGVIGGDILRKYKARIDYGKKQLVLEVPASVKTKPKKKVAKKR
jgi:hypothetical protein